MQSLFSYESKFMQLLLTLADYIILNVLYLVCCIPIFTIGAAQSGLYNALRILTDKENDSSCVKAFFRGFSSGFKTITPVWLAASIVTILLGYTTFYVFAFRSAGAAHATLPFVLGIIATAVFAIYQSMMTLFHAFFGCTRKQLLRNTFWVILANPLQSLLTGILAWGPVILMLIHFPFFLQSFILVVFLYYSVAMSISIRLIKKPFGRLIDRFNQTDPE